MTPKQKVLKRLPHATLWHWADGYCIYPHRTNNPTGSVGGSGWGSPARAWMAAWRELLGVPDPARSPPHGYAPQSTSIAVTEPK